MKKNILIGLGVLLAVVVIALVGCGLYLYHIYNPKGCVDLESYNYPPVLDITEDISYASDSSEVKKIQNVKNSCLAVIKGEDSSIDECSAVNNLYKTMYVLGYNTKLNKNAADVQTFLNDTESIKKIVNNTDKSSCKEEYKAFNNLLEEMTKDLKKIK